MAAALSCRLAAASCFAFDSVDLSGRVAPSGGVTRLDLVGRAAGLAVDGISAPAIGLSLAVEAEGDDPLADRTLPFAFRAEADAIDVAGRTIPGGEATPLVLIGERHPRPRRDERRDHGRRSTSPAAG